MALKEIGKAFNSRHGPFYANISEIKEESHPTLIPKLLKPIVIKDPRNATQSPDKDQKGKFNNKDS